MTPNSYPLSLKMVFLGNGSEAYAGVQGEAGNNREQYKSLGVLGCLCSRISDLQLGSLTDFSFPQ